MIEIRELSKIYHVGDSEVRALDGVDLDIARNEYEKIPEVFDDFMEKLDEVGPNPYKGF